MTLPLPHIGQVREAVCLDILVHWLTLSGQHDSGQHAAGHPGIRLDIGPVRPAIPITAALGQARPQELRYYLAQAHYSQPVEYSDQALEDATASYQRIERFVVRARRMLGPSQAPPIPRQAPPADQAQPSALPLSFTAAMNDDLSIPAALASVHASVHDGNYAISSGDRDVVATSLTQVRSMLRVLGLDPLDAYGRRHSLTTCSAASTY